MTLYKKSLTKYTNQDSGMDNKEKGQIIKIWWDGTILIKWSPKKYSLSNMSDVVVTKWKKKRIEVRMK